MDNCQSALGHNCFLCSLCHTATQTRGWVQGASVKFRHVAFHCSAQFGTSCHYTAEQCTALLCRDINEVSFCTLQIKLKKEKSKQWDALKCSSLTGLTAATNGAFIMWAEWMSPNRKCLHVDIYGGMSTSHLDPSVSLAGLLHLGAGRSVWSHDHCDWMSQWSHD